VIAAFSGGQVTMTKVSEYIKVAEAAKILGVSQGTLRAWAESGKILMHKNPINGYRLFKRNDLEKFLKKISRPVNGR
jgi:excisionase family DNA binding protein